MGNKRPYQGLAVSLVLPLLQQRADELVAVKGHSSSGIWQAAKKKYGKGALKSLCPVCGMQVVVIPYGDVQSRLRWVRENPGIVGESLTATCASGKIVEPPTGVLGLRR